MTTSKEDILDLLTESIRELNRITTGNVAHLIPNVKSAITLVIELIELELVDKKS